MSDVPGFPTNEDSEEGRWWLNFRGHTAHFVAEIVTHRLATSLVFGCDRFGDERSYCPPSESERYFQEHRHLPLRDINSLCFLRQMCIENQKQIEKRLQEADWDENETKLLIRSMEREEAMLKVYLREKGLEAAKKLLAIPCFDEDAAESEVNKINPETPLSETGSILDSSSHGLALEREIDINGDNETATPKRLTDRDRFFLALKAAGKTHKQIMAVWNNKNPEDTVSEDAVKKAVQRARRASF